MAEDAAVSSDETRIAGAIACLREQTSDLITVLHSMPEMVAIRPAHDGVWSAAQIGHHVALTNEAFSTVLLRHGPLPVIRASSDYPDDQWTVDAPPMGVSAPAILVPPADVERDSAMDRIRAAAHRMESAMTSLSADDLADWAVALPWGTVSLYQLCEWGGGHTRRHVAQIRRLYIR
jgi:DinB family protein